MKHKVMTHGAANSREFRAGAPAEWPRVNMSVADDAVLTQQEVAAGWIFETPEEFLSRVADHLEAWNTFKLDWPETRATRQSRADEIAQFETDLETALANWASVNPAQKDVLLRRLCRFTLYMLKEGRVRFDL